ncbi:MAG: ATP-dependent Clp protease ATP-binding subunit ClpX, partial [Spirochaetaceae bacterium]
QEMLRINTENILFICGGAFVGLEKIVEARVSKQPIGFGADIVAKEHKDLAKLYAELHPEDLIRFGLIPEFIGRLPIIVTLDELDVDLLKKIITEPRNSVAKQFEASLKLDDAKLVFEEKAIEAIAKLAIERKSGARGLRAIIEKIMTDIMYEIPAIKGKKKIVITEDVVLNSKPPEVIMDEKKKTA